MTLRERLVEQIAAERQTNAAREAAYQQSYSEGRNAGARWATDGANLEDARRVREWSKTRVLPTDAVVAAVLPSLRPVDCFEEFDRSGRQNRDAFLAGFLDGVYQACQEALGDIYNELPP